MGMQPGTGELLPCVHGCYRRCAGTTVIVRQGTSGALQPDGTQDLPPSTASDTLGEAWGQRQRQRCFRMCGTVE